jgi:SAM-dependent methyltransferase
MRDRLDVVVSQRPEIETLLYSLGPERILEWVNSVGVSLHPEFRELAPPIPPLELRRIVAAPSEPVFLWTGLKDAEMCLEYIQRYLPREHPERYRILDFGCGCGRTLRFLQGPSELDVYGTDVNTTLVDWCKEHLHTATTTANGATPPFPFPSEQFHCVYSVSIFTHLTKSSTLAWLGELGRVTAVGGLVLFTTHGYPALEIILRSKQHQEMFRLSRREAELIRRSLADVGFSFRRYDEDILALANAGETYGNSFIHESYIRDTLAGGVFELLEFVPGGLRGWQDLTVLRRRI